MKNSAIRLSLLLALLLINSGFHSQHLFAQHVLAQGILAQDVVAQLAKPKKDQPRVELPKKPASDLAELQKERRIAVEAIRKYEAMLYQLKHQGVETAEVNASIEIINSMAGSQKTTKLTASFNYADRALVADSSDKKLATQLGAQEELLEQLFGTFSIVEDLDGAQLKLSKNSKGCMIKVSGNNSRGIKALRFNEQGLLYEVDTEQAGIANSHSTIKLSYVAAGDKYLFSKYQKSIHQMGQDGEAIGEYTFEKHGEYYVAKTLVRSVTIGSLIRQELRADFSGYKINEAAAQIQAAKE